MSAVGGNGGDTAEGKQFLKNPGKYKSVSAFAPIANPSKCPWGKKAFSGYLNDKSEWADYDATELVKKWEGGPLDILIDVVRAEILYPLTDLLLYFLLTHHRAQLTTSTTRASSCPRISRKRPPRRAMAVCGSGSRRAMTILISQWQASLMITLGMRRGIFSDKKADTRIRLRYDTHDEWMTLSNES